MFIGQKEKGEGGKPKKFKKMEPGPSSSGFTLKEKNECQALSRFFAGNVGETPRGCV